MVVGRAILKRRREIERELESRPQSVSTHRPPSARRRDSQLSRGPPPRPTHRVSATMLPYICLLAFIGLGSCSEIEKVMPSRFEIESSINRTIEEVEKMVRENPGLPKLNRDDIVNILYNITSSDILSMEDDALQAIQKTREDYQRALMVVLPYKPSDSGDGLTELFTKPPMVQMVPDDASDPKKDSKVEYAYNPSPYIINNVQQSENLIESKHQLVTAHMRFENEKRKTSASPDVKNFDVITTTKTKLQSELPNSNFKDFETIKTTKSSGNVKSESTPQKFTFNLEALDQRAEASHSSIATRRPIYKGTFSRYKTSTITPPKLEILYSTTPRTTTSTTTATTTTTEAITETTTRPNKPTESILSSDQWRYYAPPTTTTPKIIVQSDDSPWKPMSPAKGFFLPTVQSSSENVEEPNFTAIKMEDFQKIMEATTPTTTKPAPIFVTPSIMTNHKENYKGVTSGTKAVPSRFKLTTTTTALPTPMREEVAQLLKSIGLQPMNPTKPQNDFKFNQNNVDAQLNAYLDSTMKTSKIQINKPSVLSSTASKESAFKAPQLPIKDGVMNLSPDIQLLFQQFGLQVPEQEAIPTTTTTTTTPRPTIPTSVNSYTHFKPLPTSAVKDKDFRDFLAMFGLGARDTRSQKSMQQPRQVTKRPSLIDAVPRNMRKILENIGLIRKAPKPEPTSQEPQQEPEILTEASTIVEHTTQFNEHIFKPHEIVFDDKKQNEKIKNLLNTVKKVQEGRANVQDVQMVAHDLLQSTKSLANGPDPLKLEEILNNYRDNLKNEVKRQQEQTTTLAPETAATSAAGELDEATLSSMATTDSSASFSELSESSTTKTDQSSSSSSKPSIFDTFDISEFLNKTDTTSTTTPSSGSTAKASFFDSFDINQFISNTTATDDSGKNSNVNLADLEDSFGGSTPEPDPVLPTRPKTGLYFLVDWNTFLEVGEEGKEKVNLRFSPKVGDRSRFIPVKIP